MKSNYIYIETVSNSVFRPIWSVVIPTYNCAEYLKNTLQSVLLQDLGPELMEIIVVDDHSTKDNPEAVVKEFGQERVQFIRQKQNVGKVKNYETGLKASKGYYIHQLHGDDMVRPGFYEEIERIFAANPEAGAAFTRTIYIDAQGNWKGMTGMIQECEGIVPDMAAKLYTQQYIQTPSMVVKREVYETLGGFDHRINCMEDWEMWIRIANTFAIATSNQVLALYRTHSDNSTNLTFKDGSALLTHLLICDIVDGYIQPTIKKQNARIRNQKQAEFWLLSYQDSKNKLTTKQKWFFISKILRLDFSLKNVYRLL
ncbi:MAG: glycosyltransferase involved in cell wall biosynthesis [Psychroserpens sp.]